MSIKAPTKETKDIERAIRKRFFQVGVSVLLWAAILFIASGRPGWVWAWVYLGVYAGSIVINAAVLLPRRPEMIAERAEMKEGAKAWDMPLALVMSLVGPALILAVAGLDVRFGWSPSLSVFIHLGALVLVAGGYGLWGWAMASNEFFAGLVRIQTERGHTVATGGPYRYVRHPAYLGAIVYSLATPLLLGSLWALVPAVLTAVVTVYRTVREDDTLREELAGYETYAARVRYRLVPAVW